jgi:hypothetical protein
MINPNRNTPFNGCQIERDEILRLLYLFQVKTVELKVLDFIDGHLLACGQWFGGVYMQCFVDYADI